MRRPWDGFHFLIVLQCCIWLYWTWFTWKLPIFFFVLFFILEQFIRPILGFWYFLIKVSFCTFLTSFSLLAKLRLQTGPFLLVLDIVNIFLIPSHFRFLYLLFRWFEKSTNRKKLYHTISLYNITEEYIDWNLLLTKETGKKKPVPILWQPWQDLGCFKCTADLSCISGSVSKREQASQSKKILVACVRNC